ncbi:hypothetical protein QO010_003343 [Caulobacter ginsengisoli]|uniref:TonB C-terminal domain-containing protein n=1 Tax=Caulobacter ginsengisoli TaxID=400775 RepID=A0ABU0IWY7_9CAUL|nr:energy transducer TonB [Caulobacter ginsengisoli]MDQ0465554.1 hypothetical protein [Caulobacter ginsengisoli]
MRIQTLIAIPIAVLLASTAGAATITSENLIWAAAPSFDDMAAAWPARGEGLAEGSASLQCRIVGAGRLTGCDTLSDQPVGQGFARAAKTLVAKFQLKIDPRALRKDQDYFVVVSFRFLNPDTPPGRARRVSNPRWISMPDPGRIQGVFPKAAADAGVTHGVGVIDCQVAPDGHLTDCKVSRENPTGVGFGDAALLVAPIMQMNPWTDDGRPVDGARVKLPVQFGLAP